VKTPRVGVPTTRSIIAHGLEKASEIRGGENAGLTRKIRVQEVTVCTVVITFNAMGDSRERKGPWEKGWAGECWKKKDAGGVYGPHRGSNRKRGRASLQRTPREN